MLLSSKYFQGALILGAIGLLAGCEMAPGRYTGGGTMNSLGGAGRAQIAFSADGCDTENVKGNVTFHDKTAIEYQAIGGVSFKAKVTSAGMCTENPAGGDEGELGDPGCNTSELLECNPGEVAVVFDYTSTNPQAPGAGTGLICSQSAGTGAGAGLHAIIYPIRLTDGPYDGYANRGALVGNAMFHECNAPASQG